MLSTMHPPSCVHLEYVSRPRRFGRSTASDTYSQLGALPKVTPMTGAIGTSVQSGFVCTLVCKTHGSIRVYIHGRERNPLYACNSFFNVLCFSFVILLNTSSFSQRAEAAISKFNPWLSRYRTWVKTVTQSGTSLLPKHRTSHIRHSFKNGSQISLGKKAVFARFHTFDHPSNSRRVWFLSCNARYTTGCAEVTQP